MIHSLQTRRSTNVTSSQHNNEDLRQNEQGEKQKTSKFEKKNQLLMGTENMLVYAEISKYFTHTHRDIHMLKLKKKSQL